MESDSDTSDSSSSDSEDNMETVDDGKLDRLEAKVLANSSDYVAHRELIAALRESGQFEKLREARESFQNVLILQKDDWVQWVEDESRLANVNSPQEVQKVVELCKRATKDFQYPDVWELFLRFVEHANSRNVDPDNEDMKSFDESVKTIRNAYEDALNRIGMHVGKGASLWTKYLNFEISLHSTLKSKKSPLNKQEECVRNVAKRGLSIPLVGLEDLHETYTTWETAIGHNISKDIEALFQTTLKQLTERKTFENSIHDKQQQIEKDDQNWQLQSELIQLWMSYIKFETESPENKKNPSRAVSLFERAVENLPNAFQLWQAYVNYLEQKLNGKIVLDVLDRAVRNYPWSAELWGQYISAMEKLGQTYDQITAVFEKAFNMSGVFQTVEEYMTLLQRYLEYLHRSFASNSDNNQLISKWREALVSATSFFSQYFKDNVSPIELFKYWANIERRFTGDFDAGRQALESMVKTYPKNVDAWIFYVDFFKTQILLSKSDTKAVSNLQHQCRSVIKRMVNNCLPHEDKDESTYLEQLSQLSQYDVDRIYHTWLEFERMEGTLSQWEIPHHKFQQILSTRTIQQPVEPKSYVKKQKRKMGDERRKGDDESGLPMKKQKRTAEASTPSNFQQDSERDKRTAFVVNLPFSISQKELHDLFSQYGPVKEVRMVLDKDGKPKGYAYVEFADEAGANASLALHQTDLKGRKLKVTISSPRAPSSSAVHYNDVATVFVKNLPATVNETDISQHFQQCGTVKDVRIVKREGISRGFAYVQLGDESEVEKALSLNDTELGGQKISVAKSAPPTKKGPSVSQPPAIKPRLLVPRTLKKTEITPTTATATQPIGSNEAFRQKFLNQKKQ